MAERNDSGSLARSSLAGSDSAQAWISSTARSITATASVVRSVLNSRSATTRSVSRRTAAYRSNSLSSGQVPSSSSMMAVIRSRNRPTERAPSGLTMRRRRGCQVGQW